MLHDRRHDKKYPFILYDSTLHPLRSSLNANAFIILKVGYPVYLGMKKWTQYPLFMSLVISHTGESFYALEIKLYDQLPSVGISIGYNVFANNE